MNRRKDVAAPLGAGMVPCDAFFSGRYYSAMSAPAYATRAKRLAKLPKLFKRSFWQTKVVGTRLAVMWAEAGVLQ